MSGVSPEADLPGVLLDALLDSVVHPAIMELARETGQPMYVKVAARCQGSGAERELNVPGADGQQVASGEIRLVFKPSFEGSFNFALEAILHDVSPGTGFSGFSLRGKLKSYDGRYAPRLTARTNRYNVWNWGHDFRFQ